MAILHRATLLIVGLDALWRSFTELLFEAIDCLIRCLLSVGQLVHGCEPCVAVARFIPKFRAQIVNTVFAVDVYARFWREAPGGIKASG